MLGMYNIFCIYDIFLPFLVKLLLYNRYITASEYSQMTGRARNFNDNRGPGLSIILIDESIEKESLQKIVKVSFVHY